MNKDIECNVLDTVEGFTASDMIIVNEELWFVSEKDTKLRRMFTDNYKQRVISSLLDFEQFIPISIHFDKKNNVIWIGLKESDSDEFHSLSVTKVQAYNYDTWTLEKEFSRLFTMPAKIRSIQDQLVIIDKTSNKIGRVVSLSYDGRKAWEYSQVIGHSPTKKPFFPTSVATTADKIIVVDSGNNSIHILNVLGHPIAYKQTTDFGLERPFSIDIDSHGSLWIGSESETNNAQICVLSMSFK